MRLLPTVSDLMLLPRVIDSLASVRIENDKIHVISQQLDDVFESLSHYPHIRLERLSPTQLVIHAVQLASRPVLLHWPDGRRRGFILHDHDWVMPISPDGIDALMAAGIPVSIIEAAQDESPESALTRVTY